MIEKYTCFYCRKEIEQGHVHITNLYESEHPKDEPLCDECYTDWLEGIKE